MIINKTISIDKNYKFEQFQRTDLYDGQQSNRFFWINQLCYIEGIDAIFKIGLWFDNGNIRQIQLFCMNDNISDEVIRKDKHQQIINCEMQNIVLHAKHISNYWDKRDLYSSIIIDF